MAKGRESHEGTGGSGRRRSDGRDEGSLSSSDGEDSWHSTHGSKRVDGSYDECRSASASDPEIGASPELRRESSVSDCCSDVDLESGVMEMKVHSAKAEKECRICQVSLESTDQESGIPIELGCSCKDDLAAAHKQCAETWFKRKGNKTCEICGTVARNVVTATEPENIEQFSETSNAVAAPQSETRSFWHGHRFLNFLLACMVFAFVISWLFHFNVPS